MEKIIKFNRQTLNNVDKFITDEDYESSEDLYGLPRRVYYLINKPINNDITYTDLLMFLHSYLDKEEISYLEIGVSVLKTFFQSATFLKNSCLYAYDINNINPTIESLFVKNSSNHYTYNTNKIIYFKGDVTNTTDLNNFKNYILKSKLDIIFSDALHSYEGLMSEYNNLISYILNDKFILYYDDLAWYLPTQDTKDMQHAFFYIAKELQKKYNNLTIALLQVNGWLGNHEHKHTNGIITTINLKKIFTENNLNIKIIYLDI